MSESSSPLFTPPPSPIQEDTTAECDLVSIHAPPIKGLYYIDNFITSDEANQTVESIAAQGYFDVESGRDQAVIFGSRDAGQQDAGLPLWVQNLLSNTANRLEKQGLVPQEVTNLLFPQNSTNDPSQDISSSSYTRQLILNCYNPGQGISSHVDLPHKFLDGIMIFSFGSGIAMTFEEEQSTSHRHSVYLMPRSLCILSGESRWKWRHGIPAREGDWVCDAGGLSSRLRMRGKRLSITIRWYKLEQEKRGKEKGGQGEMRANDSDARLAGSYNG